MGGDGPRTGIYLPDDDGVPMTRVERFLDRQEESGYFLADASDRVLVPPELAQVIRTAVRIFQEYDAVGVSPRSRMLDLKEAADFLGKSEEEVRGLLTAGTLPFEDTEKYGLRIPLRDLLSYNEHHYSSWADFAADDWDSDGGAVPDEHDWQDMRQSRREVYESKQRRLAAEAAVDNGQDPITP